MAGKAKQAGLGFLWGKCKDREQLVDWIRASTCALSEALQVADAAREKWVPPQWQGCQLAIWRQMLAEDVAWNSGKTVEPGRMTIGRGFDLLRSLYRLVRAELVQPGHDGVKIVRELTQSLYEAIRRYHRTPKTAPWANRRSRCKVQGLIRGRVFRADVSLLGVSMVVRREIVVSDCSLDCLHAHLQAAMGWSNRREYSFRVGCQEYRDLDWFEYDMIQMEIRDAAKGIVEPSEPPPALDSKRISLSGIREKAGSDGLIQYTYHSEEPDDPWEHRVRLRLHGRRVDPRNLPLCLGGESACPLEETNGPEDFMKFLGELEAKDTWEREEARDWLEKVRPYYDLSHFDPEKTTEVMRRVHRG